jgi:hypothetical protein
MSVNIFGADTAVYVPYQNCGWKDESDGCCSHPRNATPECHQFCCPIECKHRFVALIDEAERVLYALHDGDLPQGKYSALARAIECARNVSNDAE